MKRRWFVVCLALLVITSFPTPKGSTERPPIATPLPANPPLNSAISAHGNTDWHIDTANEFLFGTDNSGNTSAENHAPDSWDRKHLHTGLSNTAHFYFDKALTTPGDDTDGTNGIDRAMLFFYAGHGGPTVWNTLGNNGTQSSVRLGNNSAGGLRYYWQCSCEVFAHGPISGTCAKAGESEFVYPCPEQFDGSADSSDMRNVYERWGPALQPNVRMACGASTDAYCHEWVTNKIWDDFNNQSFDVSDSFIDGLDWSGVVPLCITMGGSKASQTPLYDASFTNQPNTSGSSRYYIEFLAPFLSLKLPPFELQVPAFLPIWELEPQPFPDPIRALNLNPQGDFLISRTEIKGRGPQARVNKLSGAVYIRGERKMDEGLTGVSDKRYVESAQQILNQFSLGEQTMEPHKGTRFMIASRAVEDRRGRQFVFQKNVVVVFKRQITVGNARIRVLGEGGQIKVQMNNDGTPLNVAKVWRRTVRVIRQAPVKTLAEAQREAFQKLGNQKAYKLRRFEWGYKELAGNVAQREMRIVFRFEFVPINQREVLEYPPRMIEVQGQQ